MRRLHRRPTMSHQAMLHPNRDISLNATPFYLVVSQPSPVQKVALSRACHSASRRCTMRSMWVLTAEQVNRSLELELTMPLMQSSSSLPTSVSLPTETLLLKPVGSLALLDRSASTMWRSIFVSSGQSNSNSTMPRAKTSSFSSPSDDTFGGR